MEIQVLPSRFDYVEYDEISVAKQAKLKEAAKKVEVAIYALADEMEAFDVLIAEELKDNLGSGMDTAADKAIEELSEVGPQGDALQHLEQAYMWCGKAIRDEQIARNGSAPLQEERTDP